MKKNYLLQGFTKNVWAFLLVFIPILTISDIRAQSEIHTSPGGYIVGTSDSRLVATIEENSTSVTMKVMAIGEIRADALRYSFFFKPEVLVLTDQTITQEINAIGNNTEQPVLNNAIEIDPSLLAKGIIHGNSALREKGTGSPSRNYSYHPDMRAFIAEIGQTGLPTEANIIKVEPGKMVPLFTCYFKKVVPNATLSLDDLGIAVKTTSTGLRYSPKWTYDFLTLSYADDGAGSSTKILPRGAILFRSPSSVLTEAADQISISTAQLNGSFSKGAFSPSNTISDNINPAIKEGILKNDSISRRGFIYGKTDAEISVSPLSNTIIIDGTPYNFPNDVEIGSGSFTRGSKTFYIIAEDNADHSQTVSYAMSVGNLEDNMTYYAWAFTKYSFETSETYSLIANKITFNTPRDCIPIIAGTIHLVTPPYCGEQSTGSIKLEVTGGTGSYQYVINDSTIYRDLPDDGIIGNLAAGTYRITVRDKIAPECGTSVSEAITLKALDSDISLDITAQNASVCGAEEGSLTVEVTGGKEPYKYVLNGEEKTPVDGVIGNLKPGVYVLDVIDGDNCIASSGELIIGADNGGLNVAVSNISHTICGQNDGLFTLTVGGTAPYKYQIDGGTIISTHDNIIDIENLSAGSHTWKVTDTTGCFAEDRVVIINTGNNTLSFDVAGTNAQCEGTSGGTITITVLNGTPSYKYSLDNGQYWEDFPVGATIVTIPDIAQGRYDIMVKDGDNCVYQYRDLVINSDYTGNIIAGTIKIIDQPYCNDPTGSIQLAVGGGSGSYQYVLNDSTIYRNLPANGIITGLGAGTYRVTIRDSVAPACGNAVSEAITLRALDSDMNIEFTINNATACGVEDGSLEVTVTGGMAPYKYILNGEEKTPENGVIKNLKPGVYVLDVIDDDECLISSGELMIEAGNGGLDVTVSDVSETICGERNGTFTLTVNGIAPFQYQIDGGVVKTTNSNIIKIDNLTAGSHTWKVTDSTGCYAQDRQIIKNTGSNTLAFTAEGTNAQCEGTTGGTITITVTGGTPSYKYSLDNGRNWEDFPVNATTVTIPDIAQGSYDIIVMDADNCTYEYRNLMIKSDYTGNIIAGTIKINSQPGCDEPTGSIELSVTGGSGSYQYVLNDSTVYRNFPADGIIRNLGAGTYRVTVRDSVAPACGNAISEAITLKALDSDMNIDITINNATACGEEDGSLEVTVTGGSSPYKYILNGEEKTPVAGVIDNLKPGVYVLDVIDDDECLISSGELMIEAGNGGLDVTVSDVSETICGERNGTFTLTVNGTAPFKYQIDGGVVKTTNSHIIKIDNLTAGSHTWKVTDSTGCYAQDRQIIENTGTNTLAFTAEGTNAQCEGTTGGTITITVTGGTPSYKYSLDNGRNWEDFPVNATTVTIPEIAQGSYDVMVKDADNCTYEYRNLIIKSDYTGSIMTGTIKVKDQPECGEFTGSIELAVTGGSGKYEYVLNDSTVYRSFPADGIIRNLGAGTYRVTIRDSVAPACGSAVSEAITLQSLNSDMRLDITTENASECGVEDGSLTVYVTGGKEPYKYILNGEEKTPVAGVIDNLKPGLYVLDVIDDDDCVASSGEFIIHANNGGLNAYVDNVVHTECGENSGSFTLHVDGTPPYQYQIDGGVMRIATGNTILINNLSAGNHSWRIIDATGCYATDRQIINNIGDNTLAFTATVTNIQCDGTPGSITLHVTGGVPDFKYCIDGRNWLDFPAGENTFTITGVAQGSYSIIVKDAEDCTFEDTKIVVEQERKITSPVATTPQTFCDGATVANLEATGINIKWYLAPNGGIALDPATALIDGTVYYATQSTGVCESATRTAVKVFIDDNVVVDAPRITSPQNFCDAATLADILLPNSYDNIIWYDAPMYGNQLPLTTPLVNGNSYYAAKSAGGSCISILRTEVEVTITDVLPSAPVITSPQHFCAGATIANIAVPNTHIIWYTAASGGNPLPAGTVLAEGTYYAAQRTGECESDTRTPVSIILDAPPAPIAPPNQAVCNSNNTLADLMITGAGIVWYASETSTTPLPLNTPLAENTTYYAAQTSAGCAGARTAVTITFNCHTVMGTVFPFVNESDPGFNNLFPVTVKLYNVPPADGGDPIDYLLNSIPVHTVRAKIYDGTIFVPGTPKNPGSINVQTNPGLPIDWTQIGKTQGTVDTTSLTGLGDLPNSPVGLYVFENVAEGDYIIEIRRKGFIVRWGKITIDSDGSLGHREILPGDVDDNHEVNLFDVSKLNTKSSMIGTEQDDPKYDPGFDFNGDGIIDYLRDNSIIMSNIGASIEIYQETMDWLELY